MARLNDQLNWKAARVPRREPLEGTTVRLEPVDVERHAPALFAAGTDPAIWVHLPYGPFAGLEDFSAWLAGCASTSDPLFFAIVDQAGDRPEGMASFLRIVPDHGVIEIGHIWFSPAIQRTRQATEAIYLMIRHVFDDLGYRRLEWKCNSLNEPSRRAALRFGFTFEGIFRQHMVVKDRNRDSAWYAMTDGDWPLTRAAFESWLDPANFEPHDGRQRVSLAELRRRLAASGR
jgi:RimJ/RimL family protein N-acetyltransferase